jgi:hypothetical protein
LTGQDIRQHPDRTFAVLAATFFLLPQFVETPSGHGFGLAAW